MTAPAARATPPATARQPPYATGLEALQAGWRVIQISQLMPPYPGAEFSTSFYKHEVIFEQLEDVHG